MPLYTESISTDAVDAEIDAKISEYDRDNVGYKECDFTLPYAPPAPNPFPSTSNPYPFLYTPLAPRTCYTANGAQSLLFLEPGVLRGEIGADDTDKPIWFEIDATANEESANVLFVNRTGTNLGSVVCRAGEVWRFKAEKISGAWQISRIPNVLEETSNVEFTSRRRIKDMWDYERLEPLNPASDNALSRNSAGLMCDIHTSHLTKGGSGLEVRRSDNSLENSNGLRVHIASGGRNVLELDNSVLGEGIGVLGGGSYPKAPATEGTDATNGVTGSSRALSREDHQHPPEGASTNSSNVLRTDTTDKRALLYEDEIRALIRNEASKYMGGLTGNGVNVSFMYVDGIGFMSGRFSSSTDAGQTYRFDQFINGYSGAVFSNNYVNVLVNRMGSNTSDTLSVSSVNGTQFTVDRADAINGSWTCTFFATGDLSSSFTNWLRSGSTRHSGDQFTRSGTSGQTTTNNSWPFLGTVQ